MHQRSYSARYVTLHFFIDGQVILSPPLWSCKQSGASWRSSQPTSGCTTLDSIVCFSSNLR
jgi:hypothetical protein